MLPPEDELCLLLARAQLSPEARGRALSLLAGPLEWTRLFERAKRYGIFPLAFACLQSLGFPGIPEPVRAEWTKVFHFNAIRNEFLAAELARILRLLGEAGMPVMPLKGVTLGESLYGDPALRPCADIDVLVPQRRALEAFRLLVSSGYQSQFAQPRLPELAARYCKHFVLTRQEYSRVLWLELHSGLFWGGKLERELLEAIWQEADQKSFYGIRAYALSAEWEFLYLAVHAAQHSWHSLMWYVDLDRICRRGAIDWKMVNEKARWLGWESTVRSSLAVCQSLFETPLDPAFQAKAPRLPAPVALPSELQVVSENLFLLHLLKRPTHKLRYLAIRLLVPTPAECKLLRLPAWLFFLYYPLRPLRVVCKSAKWFVQAGWKTARRMSASLASGGGA